MTAWVGSTALEEIDLLHHVRKAPFGPYGEGLRIAPVPELAHASWIVGKGARDEPQFGARPTLTDPLIAFRTRTWPSRFGLVAAGLGICVIPEILAPVAPENIALNPRGRPELARTAPSRDHQE